MCLGEAGRKLQLNWHQVLRVLPRHPRDQAEAAVGVVDAMGAPPRSPLPASLPTPPDAVSVGSWQLRACTLLLEVAFSVESCLTQKYLGGDARPPGMAQN